MFTKKIQKWKVAYEKHLSEGRGSGNPLDRIDAGKATLTTKLQELKESFIRATTEWEKKEIIKEINQVGFFGIKEDGNAKQKEVLKKRDSFENTNVIDVLSLKRRWVWLEGHLLIDKKNPSSPVTSESLKPGTSFEVNFGKNKYMRDGLGIGDILSPEIQSIQVVSKHGEIREWTRREIGGRPWYYYKEGRIWKYIDVYDGDTINIKSHVILTEKEKEFYNKVSELHYKEELAESFMKLREQWKNPQDEFSYLDKKEMEEAENFAKNMEAERDARRKLSPATHNELEFLSNYGSYVDEVCKQVNIPQDVVIALFRKESGFNSSAKNPSWSAYGLGQIIDSTWYGGKNENTPTGESIEKKLLPRYGFHGVPLDRENPRDQILATIVLLASMRDAKWGNLFKWIMSYFWVDPNDIQGAKNANKWIEQLRIQAGLPDTADGLNQAYVQEFLGLNTETLSKPYDQNWIKNIPPSTSTLENMWVGSVEWLVLWLDAKVSDGSTWCGQTARLHGNMFGATFPSIFNSSQALSLYDSDEKVVSNNPTLAKNKALEMWGNVFDIVFENTHGSKMWHRACAVVKPDGEVYVYDPYFSKSGLIKREDPRTPVPYDAYMHDMIQGQKKILVWLWVHQVDNKLLKQA